MEKRTYDGEDEIILYDEILPGQTQNQQQAAQAAGIGAKPVVNYGPSVYEQYVANNPERAKPQYVDYYGNRMAEMLQAYKNRDPFSYDVTKDPLYQSYKDQFIQGGKLAMRDTMGQAAALTGGYSSTYGQQVGQQAYDAQLQKLGEVIPQLYGMAYDQWKDAGDQMLQQYSMMGDMREQEYGQYRDRLADWESDRAYRTALEQEDYQRRQAAENTAYNRQADAYGNLYAAIKASGYYPSDEELQAAGMSRAAADAIAEEYRRGVDMDRRAMELNEWKAYNSDSGGGSSGGGSSGGGALYYDPAVNGYVSDGQSWTFADVAGAWENAKASGNADDARLIAKYAVDKGIITKKDKKYMFKDSQVKDRL